ncbi:mitochondrial inner membrane protease ATP23 isoform X1 [Physcomitrium patens]|uniref:Mitochondrial inner membrane protease ATP23 n=1 Tax=Physcomitrium patens TaxID=3218 RepID=A0A2K1IGJ0_PHYPA|nr:mitochondrial inner membrane protease ATP23 homolog isoform X1 [Physcomitrium patens]PNR28395.1 hypothetical protein PHYPA_028987 [Physcomitrium patens]|eukprot:XP_024363931.1 mitochondrial inner membrane protease ATP23 homolog isoform X1 [Physcomitrella patens]
MEEAAASSNFGSSTGTTPEHCQQMINRSLSRNSTVKFVREALTEAGCPVADKFFKPERCSIQAGGGFKQDEGIVICSNNVTHQDEVDVALTHELLHAYDHCRAVNSNWTNCEHHACMQFIQIRAANLSGDCAWKRELLRGNTNLQKQHQQICVRRRALISVSLNPHCSMHRSMAVIDRVWKTCYNDTQPFDRTP